MSTKVFVENAEADALPVTVVGGDITIDAAAAVNIKNVADDEINPATSELQTAGNNILTTIDADTSRIPALGTAAMAASAPVTIATNDTMFTALDAAVDLINTSLGALIGAAAPAVDSYTTAAISAAAHTDNQEIVAAPGANKQIWVMFWCGSADTGDGSIAWQDEDDTALSGIMPTLQGLLIGAKSENFAIPLMKVATNKALEMDTVTCGFKGTIGYAIVSIA